MDTHCIGMFCQNVFPNLRTVNIRDVYVIFFFNYLTFSFCKEFFEDFQGAKSVCYNNVNNMIMNTLIKTVNNERFQTND